MQKLISAIVLSLFFFTELWSQCTVSINTPRDTVVCGDCIQLTTFGKGQGPIVFQENFNSGSPSGWAFTQQATFTNPCSSNGVDGTTHIWMGNNSGVPRTLQTQAYDFSPATAGATICFDLLFAAQGNSSPCEGPDEPQEGVYLQYRIGNGPWVTINYFDPNGGNDAQLVNWNNWCFPLPPAALTAGVSIRWFQDADSGADYDHWGIDNVQIYFNDPTFTINVGNGGGGNLYTFPQGSAGGAVPSPVCPIVTRTYSVVMSNTSGVTCRDSVRIVVRNPTIEINAGQDVTICEGQCTTLNASAKVIKSPAKIATYRNIQPDTAAVQSIGGIITQGATVNINVRNLNMSTVQSNSIVSVCIDRISANNFLISAADLVFYLICPDSTVIILKPSGQGTGTGGLGNYTTLYNNICFVPAGPPVSSGSAPFTGNFGTNQPFNNMVGCTANGVWRLAVTPNGFISAGNIITTGWSITFDDPEISYTPNVTWAPSTGITSGSTTLTPTVCPTVNTTYTITASDTAGCVTVTDQVVVTVTPTCCNLQIAATTTQPTCGNSNGSINITTPQGVGPYSFLWNDNNTTQNRTGLAAGTYRVTITDNGQTNCIKDTVITLNNPGTLNLTLSNPVNPACGASNGSITVALSGGTAPYTVVITNGVNPPQTINVPIAVTQPVNNLPAGSYTVTVTDAANCQQAQTITLTAPNAPTINSLNSVIETCNGANDGRITVVASGGTGTLTYLWSNSQTSATINNLSPGQYSVTVSDANNCTVTSNATLIAGPACCNLSISASTTNPTCGATDGSINLIVATGSGSYTYVWSNAATSEDLTNIGAGSYSVTITDNGQANCTRDTIINLTSANGPTISNITATNETCLGNNDGSATVSASGGTGALTYLWSNTQTTTTITGLTPGNYLVTVTDGAGCIVTGNVTVVAGPQCCNLTATVATTSTTCNAATGSITATIDNISGTAPFTVTFTDINNITNTSSITDNVPIIGFSGLAGGTYAIVIRDVNNCIFRDTVDVTEDNNTIVLNVSVTNVSCFGFSDGTAQVIAGGNGSPFIYNWSNAATTDLIDNLAAGTYNVTVTDQIGCFRIGTATITEPAPLVVNLGNDLFLCNGESATLDAGNVGSSYTWSTGDNTQTILADTTGTYFVEVVNSNGCITTDTIEVVAAVVSVDAGEAVTIVERDTANLNATASGNITQGNFVWTPANYLSCTNCPNPAAIPPVTTTYSVTYIDDNGCPANDTVTVTVLPGEYYFYMPNAFSPNEDGENDIVFPIMEGVKQFTWRIWNRWGQMVYECVNSTTPCSWDGKVKGKLLDPSVFVWEAVVEFKKPSIERYKGSLTLVK